MTKKTSTSAPLIVGLTGGIGSGKSTVAKAFIALGIQVVDADYASRAVVEPGMPALKAIEAHFGTKLMLPDGCLDRPALRQIIFSDKVQKSWLESLLHPLIRDWILSQLELALASSPYVILESPLLFEADQHLLVSEVLLVDVSVELQLTR
ncbi:MAG: dephospho-CoA kinase, partial [Porticoccaceae bacterium]